MAKLSNRLKRILTFIILLVVFNSIGFQFSRFSFLWSVILTFVLTTDGLGEWFYVTWKTLPRDYHGLKVFIRFRFDVYRFCKNNGSIPGMFSQLVEKHPYRTCFIADGKKWTYKEVDDFSNKIANMFQESGFVHGDVVALFMESIPDFVCIWLGLAKIGVVSALINFNLRMKAFAHTVNTANSKAIIFGSNLGEAVDEIRHTFTSGMEYFYYGEDGDGKYPFAQSLITSLRQTKPSKPRKVDVKPGDRMVYIYTSGTTGLPKAAVITNLRYFFMTSGPHNLMGFKSDDIIYEPLPVYHSAGGIMGVGQALCYGIPVVIKKKFSASQFWNDCIQDKCTITEYLGETCRYLLAQPPKPQDKTHTIRLMFGSGLRPQIWETFVKRFNIPKIVELYGSTEGNANIVNTDNTVGAVGFLPRSIPQFYPCILIKVDEKTGEPFRDEDGVCIECKSGEAGELVGKIIKGNPERNFDGYVNKEATSKKILKDVFFKGDQAFASGDILVMDRFGYLFFKDRTGDTFRWKGENVSTTEVEAVISNNINLKDSVVYGVEVPNCEGRAGMAAILDPTNSLKIDKLYDGLVKELPPYARPMFIRITDSLPMTATFKLKKVELQNDAFDPAKCGSHKLYYLSGSKYCPLTQQVYDDICSGKIRY